MGCRVLGLEIVDSLNSVLNDRSSAEDKDLTTLARLR